MDNITIVDAMMGRGKSSAAIRYMNDHSSTRRFLYITPFLKEVDRICEFCDFEQPEEKRPDKKRSTKYADLLSMISEGQNIASTHALFYYLDSNALDLIRSKHYTLIIDESIDTVCKVPTSKTDYEFIERFLTDRGEDGKLTWKDSEYYGAMSYYKRMADAGLLYNFNHALLQIPSPDMFRSFDQVFMLTYLFAGQYQKAYMDYYGFDCEIIGVERDSDGYKFSTRPDRPPPTDYKSLIHVLDHQRMNEIGKNKTALSKTWFEKRGRDSPDMVKVRNNMDNFFRHLTKSDANDRLWTTFKESADKLAGQKRKRYAPNFLQINAKATNEYMDRTTLAYIANRFADPNLIIFFKQRNCTVDEDLFALSSMIQWVWRSAIRGGREINLYLPSKRMRDLLYGWMDRVAEGGEFIA